MRTRTRASTGDDEVIVEFVRHGAIVRVSAMDPASLTEVVIQGPAAAGEATLRAVALRKLEHALERERDRLRRV